MTDSLISDVAAELIADLITTALRVGARMVNDDPSSPGLRKKMQESLKNNQLTEVFGRASRTVAIQIAGLPPKQNDRLRMLLVSPEMEGVIRQIYSLELTHTSGEVRSQLRSKFSELIRLYVQLPDSRHEEIVTGLWSTLLETCNRSLVSASLVGNDSATLVLDWVLKRMMLDEIGAIKQSLIKIQHQHKAGIAEILTFEESYRNEVGHRHAYITPPHLSEIQKIPLTRLYVVPTFSSGGAPLSLSQLLPRVHRTVVLGHPGGGKSTLAHCLCFTFATNYSTAPFAGRSVTPVLVTLRYYALENERRKVSILRYIEETSESYYQVKSPKGAFEYMFATGRAIVIFDGLDELVHSAQRRKVADDVEAFCRLFPGVPVLVTSREIGYDEAPLDKESFGVFRLTPFKMPEVRQYVQNWFNLDENRSPANRAEKATSFLKESESVQDLRSNPLMLGLMCNIYREENYIPQNRPEVYRKCAEMLFDRWDRRRDIPVVPGFESDFRPALAHLANWIYGTRDLERGVTEARLIAATVAYLLRRRFEDPDEAEFAARRFVDVCRGRAWVFSDVGTANDGQTLYQFTHRTFLEYFAAVSLARTNPSAEHLISSLVPRISRGEGDVVSQMAMQIKGAEIEGGFDDLLSELLRHLPLDSPASTRLHLLTFAARALRVIVPSPPVAKDIANACISFVEECTPGRSGNLVTEMDQVQGIILELVKCSAENGGPVFRTIETRVQQMLSGPFYDIGVQIVLLMLDLSVEVEGVPTFAQGILGESRLIEMLEVVSGRSVIAAQVIWSRGMLGVHDVVTRFGLSALFQSTELPLIGRRIMAPALELVLKVEPQRAIATVVTRELEAIGKFLQTDGIPQGVTLRVAKVYAMQLGLVVLAVPPMHARARFGLFATLASLWELSGFRVPSDPWSISDGEESENPTQTERVASLSPLFAMRRSKPKDPEDIRQVCSSLGFTVLETKFVVDWIYQP